ncbi:MAG: EamA family transporter [Candidatus Aenigmarchaeota archaeon]|nr:EamA family transporter [Candidatus Aenigmarchaeota archaeon]
MDRFSVRKILKNKKWLAAFGLGILGIMIYLYALRFVALNTIQPILALSMVIPVMVGMFLFKEKPGIHEITGIILIIIGVIWISV